jgi:hypothetical protein
MPATKTAALDLINSTTSSIERMVRWAARHPGMAAIEHADDQIRAGLERVAPLICAYDGLPVDTLHTNAIIDDLRDWADQVRFSERTKVVCMDVAA